MCMTDDADISNPPQVGPALPARPVKSSLPVVASNIVPAPKFLGRTSKAQPAQAVPKAAAGAGSAGVSWTTEDSASVDSILATEDQMKYSPYLHAFGPRDTTPYTPVALDIGGVPGVQHTAFQRSLLTAKERLRNLRKISLSSSDNIKTRTYSSSATVSQSSIDLDHSGPFPASASMLGAQQGSTRPMGSLEWLNMSSGPPKATLPAGQWPFPFSVLLDLPFHWKLSALPPVAYYAHSLYPLHIFAKRSRALGLVTG